LIKTCARRIRRDLLIRTFENQRWLPEHVRDSLAAEYGGREHVFDVPTGIACQSRLEDPALFVSNQRPKNSTARLALQFLEMT